jgi:hypothetical protein
LFVYTVQGEGGGVEVEGRSRAGFLEYEERGFSIINRNMIGGRYKLVGLMSPVTACAVLTEGLRHIQVVVFV